MADMPAPMAGAAELPSQHDIAAPAASGAEAVVPFMQAKACAIARFEHAYLVDLMRRCSGNVSLAARLCRTERRQLGKLLKKHGIEGSAFR